MSEMTDERLQEIERYIAEIRKRSWQDVAAERYTDDAEDFIAALKAEREENKRLREAFRSIAEHEEGPGYECDFGDGTVGCEECASMKRIATAALKEE